MIFANLGKPCVPELDISLCAKSALRRKCKWLTGFGGRDKAVRHTDTLCHFLKKRTHGSVERRNAPKVVILSPKKCPRASTRSDPLKTRAIRYTAVECSPSNTMKPFQVVPSRNDRRPATHRVSSYKKAITSSVAGDLAVGASAVF